MISPSDGDAVRAAMPFQARSDSGEDSPEDIEAEVAAVAALEVIPQLLQILCRVTGMRFAAVARVSDSSWTACAVEDDVNFGLRPGEQLDLQTTLCSDVRSTGEAIAIDHASADPLYANHRTPRIYNIESYISVPIVFRSGRYFGTLCALDPLPATVSDARTLALFKGFSELIAAQIEHEISRQKERGDLRNERARSELREQFIAILGHDLRNPLQSILAGSELLRRKYQQEPVIAQTAARILKSAKRMSALIDDVLDFARARLGGGIGVDIRETEDFEGAIAAVVEELQDSRPDRRIELDMNAPDVIHCDIDRLQQVVSNLVGNALTHGDSKSPVKVSLKSNGTQLVLEVWNDGEPIPAEALGKIFDPFWRQVTSKDRQGLGLGLHICSQIARAHGGSISVNSAADVGTTFAMRIPL